MVVAELIEGACASRDAERNIKQTLTFIDPYETVPFDKDTAMICGKVGAKLRAEGRMIGPKDLMIAATVISRNGVLVTNNTKEFSRIEGLRLEDWTEP
ncbi:MAG: type II toxin-antitoxin system VapC family toxin [Methanomassiliicoccaceae archaeon]|nr:type II toxin-antitoxin system VapC family toxin [Methanomassiliicoccaceae archaeon]